MQIDSGLGVFSVNSACSYLYCKLQQDDAGSQCLPEWTCRLVTRLQGDQLFLEVFLRNRPGFWILVIHHHVVNTPLYHEPGKMVKRNEYTRFEEIYDLDFLICKSGLRPKMTCGVTWINMKANTHSLPPSWPPCPEEDTTICICARLNDWVPINLHAGDDSFVFKMAINCINTDRAGEKWRVLKCWS